MAQGHDGDWFDGIGGLSVCISPPDGPQSTVYANLAFARDTGWDKMLAAYRERVELERG